MCARFDDQPPGRKHVVSGLKQLSLSYRVAGALIEAFTGFTQFMLTIILEHWCCVTEYSYLAIYIIYNCIMYLYISIYVFTYIFNIVLNTFMYLFIYIIFRGRSLKHLSRLSLFGF